MEPILQSETWVEISILKRVF